MVDYKCLDGLSMQVPKQSVCSETADEIALAAYNRALKLSMPGIVHFVSVLLKDTSGYMWMRISFKLLLNMLYYSA